VLLVLHGSRVAEWQDTAKQYVELLRENFQLVKYGFIEFNKPSLRESAEELVLSGADEIVVVPLLFAAGAHFKRDIPKLLGMQGDQIVVNGKRVRVKIGDPVGVDRRVAEVLVDRVRQVISS